MIVLNNYIDVQRNHEYDVLLRYKDIKQISRVIIKLGSI